MLVAFCGLAGAGKSTAVEVLERLGLGARVYVGSFVTAEVARRGLPPTPGAERRVREELRDAGGMAALAELAVPTIGAVLAAGRPALVDAVYCAEEYRLYRGRFGSNVVRIAVRTRREFRESRLATRLLRPIDAEALVKRDEFELGKLGLSTVMSEAEFDVANDGSLDDLERALKEFSVACGIGGAE